MESVPRDGDKGGSADLGHGQINRMMENTNKSLLRVVFHTHSESKSKISIAISFEVGARYFHKESRKKEGLLLLFSIPQRRNDCEDMETVKLESLISLSVGHGHTVPTCLVIYFNMINCVLWGG